MSDERWVPREILKRLGATPEEVELVLWWAFGYGYREIPLRNMTATWNHLHGDLHIFKWDESVWNSTALMLRLFKERFDIKDKDRLFYRVKLEKSEPLTLSFEVENIDGNVIRPALPRPDLDVLLKRINREE